MGDLISRQAAIDAVRNINAIVSPILDDVLLIDEAEAMTELMMLPSAQPELIEKAAYIRGFEQGRTQGMIDTKAEEVAQPDLQPTCNKLATDAISRQAAIDILDAYQVMVENGEENPYALARLRMSELPSAQPATNCSEIPNTSDFVSRKAVREMVATWSYDMAEWEDMELALHDVDELPPVSVEREGGKKNEGHF